MKKVIIIYGPTSQKHLIDSIIKHCSDGNLCIDAFCTGDYTFNGISRSQSISHIYKIISKFLNVRFVGRILDSLFLTPLLIQIAKEYDIIDITFFTNKYYRFLDYLISLNKKYKITIWGSDFYRASKEDRLKKAYYLENAKLIQVETTLVKRDVLMVYPSLFDKIKVCNYGIDLFHNIDSLRNKKFNLSGVDTGNCIVLTCGYNGSKAQQHLRILGLVSELPAEIKKKIFLFLPMTYGVPNKTYLQDVEYAVQNTNISYHIFTNRLNNDELAEMRLLSDIVINTQVTDAFSSSLIEHIYAGGILMAGDWLPYSVLTDVGISYIPINFLNLKDELIHVIQNIKTEKQRMAQNIEKAMYFSSWKYKEKSLRNIFSKM